MPGAFFVFIQEVMMLLRYRCGHLETCGLWKDGLVLHPKNLCRECTRKEERKLSPLYKTFIKGVKVIVLKLRV